MTTYNATIGMEIHVELATDAKMFSFASNGLGMEEQANTAIDPVVMALPGALPVPNKQAIRFVHMAGTALGCTLRSESKFDRKNYFYPDLPKGYQISQYDQPLCEDGTIDVDGTQIGITRIHMEEDTGKSQHPKNTSHTLVDYNRAGVPLMELVSEPDITSGAQARAFCQELQQIFRYLGISDADIEKGQMRCEVNISLYKEGEDKLSGTKVEIKNIGSLRSVERAANYEIERQSTVLEDGGTIVQETRGWDDDRGVSVSQRSKENADDYRYFPEPDIPPMTFSEAYFAEIKEQLPELPRARRQRFADEYGIRAENIDVLIADKKLADFFENVVSEIKAKSNAGESETAAHKTITLAANYTVSELQKLFVEHKTSVTEMQMTAENFAELMGIIADGTINSSAAQTVLAEMFTTGADPSHIIEEKNLAQESDEGALLDVVQEVMAANAQSVADYKAGKENAIKALMGQVMKATGGKANPQVVMELLKKELAG